MATEVTSLDALLEHLKRARGFDFTGYKRSSLERRIAKRMEEVGDPDHATYLDRLEVEPDEFHALFDTILINVTGFFRDPAAWQQLTKDALPGLLAAIGNEDPVRVWCAGCASGEEAYTLVMVLADLMGEEAYCKRVKVYATDVDEPSLSHARAAVYSGKDVEAVPAAALERYFNRVGGDFVFRKDFRRTVIFGRNDLVQDAPISRIDLLTCRNTLMYLNADTQATVLRRLHFALNDRGLLMLGRSEMLVTRGDLFRPLDLRQRIFAKVVTLSARDRRAELRPAGEPVPVELRETALDAGLVAEIVVDADGILVSANERARAGLGIRPEDIGRLVQDTDVSFRPVELRSNLQHVAATRREHVIPDVVHHVPGRAPRHYEVHLVPLQDATRQLGAAISYLDVSDLHRAEAELADLRNELDTTYEELQSTVEELETTNEELQSTNEELETTNEEIQASNEELETINEELQSTNEELGTLNDELRSRTVELNDVNAFLERVLVSLDLAVVVVDREQTVQVWNGRSTDLWGLRPEEAVGQRLLSLDFGLPVAELRSPLRAVLSGDEDQAEAVVVATDRLGRSLDCEVTVLPLGADGDDQDPSGAIVLMQRHGAPAR